MGFPIILCSRAQSVLRYLPCCHRTRRYIAAIAIHDCFAAVSLPVPDRRATLNATTVALQCTVPLMI